MVILNPTLVKYLKRMLLTRREINEETFDDIDCWIKLLGKQTLCASCKETLPYNWKRCEYCLDCVCDKCHSGYSCLMKAAIEAGAAQQENRCIGCGAPDTGGLCYDCRHE